MKKAGSVRWQKILLVNCWPGTVVELAEWSQHIPEIHRSNPATFNCF